MRRTTSIMTGESGVVPFTESEYKVECDPEFMTTFFCSYYEIPEPTLKENPRPASGRWSGMYYPDRRLLSFNARYQGLIIHELAHCIVHGLGLREFGIHHGPHFSRILQEMIDLWR